MSCSHTKTRCTVAGVFALLTILVSAVCSAAVSEHRGASTRGWYGLGLETDRLVVESKPNGDHAIFFSSIPQVFSVEEDSPASRAGIRSGDRITHIDGLPLDEEAGGRLFSNVVPGQQVALTVNRGGQTLDVRLTAERREEFESRSLSRAPVATTLGTEDESGQHLRYAGSLGGADIEVRGEPDVAIYTQPGEVVIRTEGHTIRLTIHK